jgi:aminoglycoside phosphotransferase (APT) family kinase protein
MRTIDVKGLPLIARGGQAEIYDYEDGRVLRVARRSQDFDRLRYEYEVYELLAGTKVSVPRAYELVEADGSPAIIMDRLSGGSMMDQIRRRPLSAKARAIELAELHLDVSGVDAPKRFTSAKTKAEYCIGRSEALGEEARKRILDLLENLPEGASLCHGDFHPGNILCERTRKYIIDWSAASRGDFHADVAHTFLLMRVVPRAPGVSRAMHFVQRRIGRAVADTYLSAISRRRPIDSRTLSRWTIINAAERTWHGLPSEQEQLLRFVDRYLSVIASGGAEDSLYREI